MSTTVSAPVAERSTAFNHGRRIGVLIVTYNAVTTLAKVLDRIPREVWDNIEQVAIFDDASQDATYALAVGLKTLTGNDKLHVLKHSKNLGYGGNQKAGYQHFVDHGFDAVVLLHGDGQYAPEILATLYHPIVSGQADAVFGSRMMRDYGGPLKGGMPLYKYVGNRILTGFENRALGMNLTEFHSGYRAYSLRALKDIDFTHMTDDFHFDTEIIIKLHHQGFRIAEVPIPTYYGDEICYVKGLRYAWDVARAVRRYDQTRRSIRRHPEFAEYFVHYPVKTSSHSSHAYLRQFVGSGNEVLDVGCGEGFLAKELHESGNTVYGVDVLPQPQHSDALAGYVRRDLDGGLGDAFADRQFDRVLLMDVLEHLRAPEKLLAECRSRLRRNGFLLVSVPNVANITVRLMLLFGVWRYADRGIMDRTHLRFYTRRTARRMLE
ncbi:MAG TPA: bifunctional glycosyltransferase/class I SAM-dependent methyltransferase, partial [Bryobacteraceae bacterium]|nr:bifunctional glycosyltransferase/class I SAM-dependent methyltransferase [Bryobacteraceae bacterium]